MKRYVLLSSLVYIFLLACSPEEEANTPSGDEVQSLSWKENSDLIQANFLSTFTNYYGRDNIGTYTYRGASLAVEWEHTYDEEGRLLKSIMYEKYPTRVLKEISFSDYSSDNSKINIQISTYNYFLTFQDVSIDSCTLQLKNDFSLDRIIYEDGGYRSFDELNSQGFVTKLGEVTPNGTKIWTTNYEYDQEGNATKYYTTYHQYSMQEASVDYTYTDFGDPKSYHFQNEAGLFSKVEYFYREDNTLERLEESFDFGNDDAGTRRYFYTNDEAFSEIIIDYDNGAKTLINYDHNLGKITERYYTIDGNLSEVYNHLLVPEDQRYYLATIEKYLDGLINSIKYFDTDNDIMKEEFYDENGVLNYIEYYDENGNYTHTENA